MQGPQVSHVAANHQSRRANYGWHSATVIYVLKCKDVKTDDHGNDIAASNSPFRLHLTERARKGLHLGVDNCHRPTCKQTNTHKSHVHSTPPRYHDNLCVVPPSPCRLGTT